MTILVVDDSRAMRSIILRALREMGLRSHTFVEAGNGREALVKITETQPELVICDLNMPEMNGLELLRTLKAKHPCPAFGFVTSEVSTTLKNEAREAGAAFVLGKPFTVTSFSEIVGPIIESLGSGPLLDCDGGTEYVPAENSAFNANQIGKLLTSLTRKRVQASRAQPMPMPPTAKQFVAEYLAAHSAVVSCGICDLAFAAHVGAAVSGIPSSASEDALSTGKLTESMYENLREVLNVSSRFFAAGEENVVSLGKVYLPGETLPPELLARMKKPATRLDVCAAIDTYGEGNLTLVTLAAA